MIDPREHPSDPLGYADVNVTSIGALVTWDLEQRLPRIRLGAAGALLEDDVERWLLANDHPFGREIIATLVAWAEVLAEERRRVRGDDG